MFPQLSHFFSLLSTLMHFCQVVTEPQWKQFCCLVVRFANSSQTHPITRTHASHMQKAYCYAKNVSGLF